MFTPARIREQFYALFTLFDCSMSPTLLMALFLPFAIPLLLLRFVNEVGLCIRVYNGYPAVAVYLGVMMFSLEVLLDINFLVFCSYVETLKLKGAFTEIG